MVLSTPGIVTSSMRRIETGSPVMAGVQRLRNARRTSAIGSAHCGASVCASFASINCFSAALSAIQGLPRVLLQIFMDESDCHAALSDRRGNSLDRTQPHVPTGENTGDTRFEEVGIAAPRPAARFHHIVTGQQIASRIACDVHRQPTGLCVGADENEEATAVLSGYLCARAIAYVDSRKVRVAMRGDHFRAQLHFDVRFHGELLDQVTRHALLQGIAPDDERYSLCMIGKVQRGLAG